jgi:hypothetical protein
MGNCNYDPLLRAALRTLPAHDQPTLWQAEFAMMAWPKHLHTHDVPAQTYFPDLGLLGVELRLIKLTAAFTDLAYDTVLLHLSGRRSLHDWQPVTEVSCRGRDLVRQVDGMNLMLYKTCACCVPAV